jgi:hypothetical protein
MDPCRSRTSIARIPVRRPHSTWISDVVADCGAARPDDRVAATGDRQLRIQSCAFHRAGAVRARFQVMNVIDVEGEGVQVVWDVTLEIEGGHKPAGVVEFITRNYF